MTCQLSQSVWPLNIKIIGAWCKFIRCHGGIHIFIKYTHSSFQPDLILLIVAALFHALINIDGSVARTSYNQILL
jgi:hypothetical protein